MIQQVMGHASIQMTFDRYGHLMPGGLAEAAARVDDYLERPRASDLGASPSNSGVELEA